MTDPDGASEIGRLPLLEERLRVARQRRVTACVRVAVTTEVDSKVTEALRHSRTAVVERVPLNQVVDSMPEPRREGDMLVVPVVEERLVLTRQLVVTEELRIRLHHQAEIVPITIPLLRQRADIQRTPSDAVPILQPIEGDIAMQRTITAMFDTRAEAENAAEGLRGLGVGVRDVTLHASETAGTGPAKAEDRGILASIANLFVPDDDRATYGEGIRRGATLLTAQIDETQTDLAMDILEQEGAVDLDAREQAWRQEGWTDTTLGLSSDGTHTGVAAMQASNPPGTMASRAIDQVAGTNISGAHPEHTAARTGVAGREESIPMAEERLRIGKRETHAGRVRVRSYVVETPVEEQVSLREERVRVERHAVDRAADASDADLFRDRVIEAEESIEEAVVQKDVRVTGEVVVNRDVTQRTETVRDTVRRTEVEIDDSTLTNTNDRDRSRGKGAA